MQESDLDSALEASVPEYHRSLVVAILRGRGLMGGTPILSLIHTSLSSRRWRLQEGGSTADLICI